MAVRDSMIEYIHQRTHISESLKCFQALHWLTSKKDLLQIFAGGTAPKPFKTMGANELPSQMPTLQRFGNSLSFSRQGKSCTGQRASVGYLDLLSSKSGGHVSTFTPDTCTAGTGGSLQKPTLDQHMLQEVLCISEVTWAGQAEAETGVNATPP